MKFAFALLLTATTLLTSANVFAINCSVSNSDRKVVCTADIKRDKNNLIDAANNNCQSSGFLKVDSYSLSYSDCNGNGTKCKKVFGNCAPKVTNNPPLCPPGTVWNPKFQKCMPINNPTPCPPGTVWNPLLKKCLPLGGGN
jgi:hypothetical protein